MPTVVRVQRRRVRRREMISGRGKILAAGAGLAAIAAMAAAVALRPSPPPYIPPAAETSIAAAPPSSTPPSLAAAEDPTSADATAANATTVATAPVPAPTPPDGGGGQFLDNPTWTRTPSPEDMLRLYPANAGGDGQVVIKCVIAGDASPSDCSVISETPANMGFGAAATQLASYYGLAPTLADGASSTGALVVIPIQFHRGSDDQAPAPAAPAAGATSDAAPPSPTP